MWGFLPFEKQLFYFIIWRLFAGCSALRHGDSEAGATGLLQGSGLGQGRGCRAGVCVPLGLSSCSPPFSCRASCLLVSASCPTPCSRLCFWNSFASTLASKCHPDVAEQLGHTQLPAPVYSRVPESWQLSTALSPAPAQCAPAAPLWPRTPTLACLASPVTIVPFRAAGFTSTSHRR